MKPSTPVLHARFAHLSLAVQEHPMPTGAMQSNRSDRDLPTVVPVALQPFSGGGRSYYFFHSSE
jgi:hypothetical protein